MKFQASRFSPGGSYRVEVALLTAGGAAVRKASEPAVMVVFPPDEWAAFVAGVKAGEFDPKPARTS